MTKKDLIGALVQIHNYIAAVTVNGDNAICIGNSLQMLRTLIETLSNEKEKIDDSGGGGVDAL